MTQISAQDQRFEREALSCLPDVSRYALSLTREQSEADDLVQETFLRAYTNWHQFNAGSECRAWLFTICRNQFLRTRKRGSRSVRMDDAALESLASSRVFASAHESGLDRLFEQREIREAVEAAIAELPEAYREVALLVDVHDQSYDAVSQVLGVPIGTVRSRLFRARRILQEQLLAHARDAGLAGAGAGDASGEER